MKFNENLGKTIRLIFKKKKKKKKIYFFLLKKNRKIN